MNNNLFLKKYLGSSEFVTKEGPLGILNNLHYNIIGYKPKEIKKKKPPKKKEPAYSYITSIVKDDFNKNKNFISQISIFLNYLKNKEINEGNIIKSKTHNNYEENQNNFINNNDNNNDNYKNGIFRKKLKLKTDNLKSRYNNINRITEENIFKIKNKRINNKILNINESKTTNNNFNSFNYENNSQKILPLINLSQDINHNMKKEKGNKETKKYYTPLINRQSNLYNKNNFTKFHLNKELDKLIKRSNSTMNILRRNNNINIENNYRYNNNDNFQNSRTFRKEINENKILNDNQIFSNVDVIKFKRRNLNEFKKRLDKIIRLNKEDNASLMNNEPIKENNNKNLYIINEENDDNIKENINDNIDNNKSLNLLDILMKQRQKYFKNIENSISYKRAMSVNY